MANLNNLKDWDKCCFEPFEYQKDVERGNERMTLFCTLATGLIIGIISLVLVIISFVT
jgi:hypothetical protein